MSVVHAKGKDNTTLAFVEAQRCAGGW